MNDQHLQLRARTQDFALRILKLSDALPRSTAGRAIAAQIIRAGTSVGANYRAAGRSQSRRDFVAKLNIVLEEVDETQYWLELINRAGMVKTSRLGPLQKEAAELAAIFTASRQTAKAR